MKRLLLVLLFWTRAEAAIQLVATSPAAQATIGANYATTAPIDTTGASLLVLVVTASAGIDPTTMSYYDAVQTVGTGNGWHFCAPQRTSTVVEVIAYSYNRPGGGGLTAGPSHVFIVSNATPAAAISVVASAWSGTRTASDPLEAQSGGNTGAGTASTLSTGNITPAGNGRLAISGFGPRSAVGYTTTPLPMVVSANWVSGSLTGIAMAAQIQGTAAAVNNTWSMGASGQMAASTASFLPASAVVLSAAPPRRRIAQ